MMAAKVARVRATARQHEKHLPQTQRKQLGQHFSGLRVGRLLAHLALDERTRTVLDPMAGSGDLLDATLEAAHERGLVLDRLDGVEVHTPTAEVCRNRMEAVLAATKAPASDIVAGNAFDQAALNQLAAKQYDLVITNPPYVRCQGRAAHGVCHRTIRRQLHSVLAERQSCADSPVWRAVAAGYSGLADLSIPAWLVAAAMVRDGGRLAIVAPATWRSRDYADVIRYLMSNCFELEHIVEGPRSAWFSDALVCTHLVVAQRRLPATAPTRSQDAAQCRRRQPLWVRIGTESATLDSLVGTDFPGPCPERRFAVWLRGRGRTASEKPGIEVNRFDLANERKATVQQISRRRWYRELLCKGRTQDPAMEDTALDRVSVPAAIAEVLPDGAFAHSVTTFEESDIAVGQGLRTGCNAFFYVSAIDIGRSHTVVETAALFDRRRFAVPNAAIQPVVRRQADLVALEAQVPDCRVLDLRSFALPEDMPAVSAAEATYRACGEAPPQAMPADLADYVRLAAHTAADRVGRPVSELSAVRTNRRLCRPGKAKPRFWYMLPDFASRHSPAAAVPRVNHGLPWTEANRHRRLLVDANFATVWTPRRTWSRYALKALLNSIWCRAIMEALCTPLGGGALKVEATHLRRLPVPRFSAHQRAALSAAGRRLTGNAPTTQAEIDQIVIGALYLGSTKPCPRKLADVLHERATALVNARRS